MTRTRMRKECASIGAAALLYLCMAGAASLHAQDAVTPETSLANAGITSDSTGEDIFRMACSTCHAIDGKGARSNVVGFELPLPNGHDFPDFNDCPTNTVEPLRSEEHTSELQSQR